MTRERRNSTENTLNSISRSRNSPKAGFAALLFLYVLASVFVILSARSEGVILLMGQPVPLRMLTGAISAVANMCIVCLVVFYKRAGFWTSLMILVVQFSILITGMIKSYSPSNISGICTNALVLVAILMLYLNSKSLQKYQERIRLQAVTDGLTKLPNRFAVSEYAGELIRRREKFAFATFDLDNFKNINNTMGHSTGDAILSELAKRWREAADRGASGTEDFIAYNGGDEFALTIRGYRSEEDILRTIGYYESAIEEKLTLDDCDFFMTTSIGYAEYPVDAADVDSVISHANTAMYEAKRTGERICRFAPELSEDEYILEMERCIRYALENDTLYFHLQPQYDIDHNLRGFEALARMDGPDGSSISPADFIPVAEEVGLIDQVDTAVFRKSAEFMGDLIKVTNTKVSLSVNISVRHLMKNDFLNEVRDILDTCGVPAQQLEIEITESVMIDSIDKALECISEIKRMGIRIAIDDFGTGYSSLSYLNEFPADMLKIDKSFIDRMNQSDSSKKYVSAIISIGHVMHFDVIAEGVEQPEQLDTLRSIGCDYIQGYTWGRPMEAGKAAKLVEKTA